MPAADFKTIPDELLHVASAAEAHFQDQGYDVRIEQREIGFPYVPALVCRQEHEVVIVEIFSSLDVPHIDRWIRYCMSQADDTRYYAIIRTHEVLDPKAMKYAVENRLGLGMHDDQELVIVRPAGDLAVHVALPELRSLAKPLRPILAPSFQKIRDGDWRDGLSGIYLEVEQRARDYLKVGIAAGRIVIVRGKANPRQLGPADVEEMTLGQLRVAFSDIQKKTQKDSLIEATLAIINRTRIGLAHKRKQKKVEGELRQQIGRNVHAVVACLEEMLS